MRPDKTLFRVIDANFNRAKEGLRVCEDVCRFLLNQKKLSAGYKALRHQLTGIIESFKIADIINARDIKKDVGKSSIKVELKRRNSGDIFYANSQRAKESVRVLEEFMKLFDARLSQRAKQLRYKIYDLEREAVKKL